MVVAEMMTEIPTVSRIGIVGQVLRLVLWVAATVLSILGLLEYSHSADTEMELQQLEPAWEDMELCKTVVAMLRGGLFGLDEAIRCCHDYLSALSTAAAAGI
ncbi:hypothetical protein F0562_019456 [Nyssa sinensis]|uniref:Uncharacterized protein n=1 Tax=Nyssa sinensis TaxID=561372 RepID=A0A5J5BSG6_9ASTE|nr:hypothetical protein F0562_019456 [Nyssa sinensis]